MTVMPLERGALLSSALRSEDGQPVALRGRRGPLVLFVLHSGACDACLEYVRSLAAGVDAIADWGAMAMVVVPDADGEHGDLRNATGSRLRLVTDPERVLLSRIGDGRAAVLVADEWGELYFVHADVDHDFPAPGEIAEWVRFISIQCPECEQPEGAWRTL